MESWPTCTKSSSLINDYANHDQGLPPGFRFHPTDEELVTYYLAQKVENANFMCRAVAEADLNKSEPWDLPEKAQMGEKEWYFYSARDRKYPTGMRTNRATESGYWKATGKDREVVSSNRRCSSGGGGGRLVGMKKTLVFYKGRAPKGVKTNWVMHEYRTELGAINTKEARGPSSHSKDDWVVCRIFHKSAAGKKMGLSELRHNSHHVASADVYATSLPALLDSPAPAASSGGSGAQLRAEESLMLNTILQQQHYNGPFGALDSSVKVEPAASAAAFHITPAPPRGLLLPHDFGQYSLLHDNAGLLNTMPPPPPLPPPSQFHQYRTQHHFHPSVTNTAAFDVPPAAATTIAQQPLSAAADHPSNNSPMMINNISLAPLSRFPSDLDSLWFYNDNL